MYSGLFQPAKWSLTILVGPEPFLSGLLSNLLVPDVTLEKKEPKKEISKKRDRATFYPPSLYLERYGFGPPTRVTLCVAIALQVCAYFFLFLL